MQTCQFNIIPFIEDPPPALSLRAGVSCANERVIVQVLGPNLDPRFPECLANEPERARYLLRECYDKSLDSFWKLVS
ncbi:unnamed protein product, partial [Ectocarpus sp. 8 AP-2014]